MNYDHVRSAIVITGQGGTGKTWLFLRLLQQWRARKLVFDPEREASQKLNVPPVTQLGDIAGKFRAGEMVLFDPAPIFGGDLQRGFGFFADLAFNLSKRFNGPKLLAWDESQQFTSTGRGGIPRPLRDVLMIGRREEIDLLIVTNSINETNDALRKQLKEIVAFQTLDPLALDWLSKWGSFDRAELAALPARKFVAHNLATGEWKRN